MLIRLSSAKFIITEMRETMAEMRWNPTAAQEMVNGLVIDTNSLLATERAGLVLLAANGRYQMSILNRVCFAPKSGVQYVVNTMTYGEPLDIREGGFIVIAEQTLTVRLPASVVAKLKRAAVLTYRTVDDIVATTVDAALAEPQNVPADLAAELAAMHLLSDQALLGAAQPSLSPAELHRLGQLNQTAGTRHLTRAEATEQEALLESYHASVLRRAQALAILAQRGHEIPDQTSLRGSDDGWSLDS